jgi:hypothetical protein
MFLVGKDLMFSIGYVTILLYLASVTFFFLGMLYSNFFIPGFVLGALFFAAGWAIVGVMMKKRMGT